MLLKNAVVHDGLGNTFQKDVLVENGRIVRIADSIEGEGFDLSGKHLLPGFVQPISNWGVNGTAYEIRPSANDNDEHSDPITPELDGFYAFNGRAATAQQLGAFGLITAGVAPTDNNLFGGTVAAFHVDGVNPYKLCLRRDIAMMASVTPNLKQTYGKNKKAPVTRMWIYTQFAEQLRKAGEYKEDADKPKDVKLAALKRVVEGELPLFVSADSALAVRHVWEIVRTYPKLRLVLVNGFGLTGQEDWIIEHKIPVIFRTAAAVLDKAAMAVSFEAVRAFMEQGVPVAFAGEYSNMFGAREDMLWNGIELMRVLHDADKSLPLLTSVPAQLLGIADQTGSIQEGLLADLVVWSANPLESWEAHVVTAYQAGEVIYKEGDALKCM